MFSQSEGFSEGVQEALLEDIRLSNPGFPVKRFFNLLSRKHRQYHLDCPGSELTEEGRSDGQNLVKTPKRRLCCQGPEGGAALESTCPPWTSLERSARVKPGFRNRMSRTQRLRQQRDTAGPLVAPTTVQPDCVREDVPWTEKYRPQRSCEVMGNFVPVRKLYKWMKEWKLKADHEEQKKKRDQKDSEKKSWDCGDFEGEVASEGVDDELCNTLLITGPHGVGKTAAVYACAEELGFKVFEVNASSHRNGRLVLAQIMEATQSHQVNGRTPASRFRSYEGSADCSECRCSTENSKRETMSLILFEEVDVVFSEDVGFLAAIKTFMSITRRPVVLTTSDASFRETFDGHFRMLVFKKPTVESTCSYLQLVCLTENMRTEPADVTSLLHLNNADIRRCLLELQFWAQSGRRQVVPLRQGGSICLTSLLRFQTRDLGSMVRSCSWTERKTNRCLELLTESWAREVDILYSNMEVLLQNTALTNVGCCLKKTSGPGLEEDFNVPKTFVQKSTRMVSRLRTRKGLSLGCRSYPDHNGEDLPMGQAQEFKWSLRDVNQSEKKASELVSSCLSSLGRFLDHMSFLDSHLQDHMPELTFFCRQKRHSDWSPATFKDGMLDEMREEDIQEVRWQRSVEMRAAVEGLGFQLCLREMDKWSFTVQGMAEELGPDKWQQFWDEFSLTVPPHQQTLSLGQRPLCEPRFPHYLKVISVGTMQLLATDFP
ncbi:ATPase family AAA domain-containing protein 5b isoform X2 [Denticeps clupeoides]|uniref:ATPase family AAA domain-containing protein 5b isoform X2 n=1 Tax=Denticeps clupeoides TaxID=299321 RepID=UPI0010A4AC01|nr:ATPase family AAA domain-containing protein 5-like isoform X2 [Denticeps clupeoides]